MPSFLGRLLGLSFRTELLIMNLVGLVNSTLDWSPLKWTNKLERIWNLSLSQRTLILDTIGEDTIKTVLSWVVITRIVIAHVYTFTYVTNIYPIITWSRPNLLLPWLILSFFKNVVLEVVVIVIGLLIWYETQFSVIVFLEFILVKLVPLVLACYNWYSNSCLFMRLRYMEKMRTLRRTMRSDSNLISSRLCAKMEDTKYRTKSLTTLLSCESYETYDTRDTISRILEDSNLTPAQKTMKILGLTEKHVEEARLRIKDRLENRRLTETSEMFIGSNRKEVNLYLMLESEYEISNVTKTTGKRAGENLGENLDEKFVEDSSSAKAVPSLKKESSAKALEAEEKPPEEASARNAERPVSRKKREGTEEFDTKRTKQMKLCPSCHVNDKTCSHLLRRREATKLCCSRQTKKTVEKSCSPMKLQELFNCTCVSFGYPFAGATGSCCLIDDITLRTSTPKKCSENKEIVGNKREIAKNPEKAVGQDYVYSCDVASVKNDFALAGASPLMESLLKNDLKILKSVATANQTAKENTLEDKAVQGPGAAKPEQRNLSTDMFSNYRSTLIDLQDLSSDAEEFEGRKGAMGLNVVKETSSKNAEEKADSEFGTTSSKSTEDGACAVPNSLPLYSALGAEKNAVKLNLPEYSYGNTNIPRFYKDSMTVFDGCYERDFDNNSELQCLLEQMNRKKWNLFPSEGGLKMLLAAAFSKEVDNIMEGIQNLKIEDSVKVDRYEVPVSKTLKSTSPVGKSREVQVDESQHYVSRNAKSIPEPVSSSPPVKDVYTQTIEDFHPKSSFSSTVEAWKRKKRRRVKDQSASTISVDKRSEQSTNKVEPCCSSVSKDRSRSSIDLRQRVSSKASNREPKRQPSLTKSQSDKSVCECKMQKLEAKRSPSSEFERRDDNPKTKQRVDSFGTIPLAQVGRTTDAESIVFRRKPPVYPKKKKENPSQMTVKKVASRSSPKPQESGSKQSTDKRWYGSKVPKAKGRIKSSGEQEAFEMKALKAYNEVTLLKDKSELEAKKFPGRNPVDPVAEDLKSRPQAKRETLNRARKDIPKKAHAQDEDHLNKENLLVDAMTETDLSIFSTSKDVRFPLSAPSAKSFSVLNERYPGSKLLSVNRATERLLGNFDRLHSSQAEQGPKKGKPAAEPDSRKQYTKYSKPKKLVHEENLSMSSGKKLEGTQKGRELERTPAKEDVRGSTVASGRTSVADQEPGVGSSREAASSEARKQPLMTIKSTVDQQVVSSWSSSTVDQVDEAAALFDVDLNIDQHMQALLGTDESEDKNIDKPEAASLPAIPSSWSVPMETRIEIPSGSEEDSIQIVELAQTSSARGPRRADLTDFTRSIDVSRLANGVVIANTNAQGKSRPRDIVDDRTARLVHNAFSYKSMESLLDLPPDAMAMEDILNDNQLQSNDDEFVCRPSNEAVDVFPEELPLISDQGNSLEQTILATIRDTHGASQPEGSCDLCIITIDHEDPSADPEAEDLQSFSSLEAVQPGVSELQISDVLSSITEVFRNLNIRGLDLHNLSAEKFEMLQNLLYVDEGEPWNEGLEIDEVEEQEKVEEEEEEWSKEEGDAMRFIKEDIFTNIKFPIVIDSLKLYPNVLTVLNDDPQQLSTGAQYGDLVGTRFLLSIEARKDEDEDAKIDETGVEVFETSTGETWPLKKHALLDALNDSDSSSSESLDLRFDSSDSGEYDYGDRRFKIVLNETFEIVRHETSSGEEIFEDQGSIGNEEFIKREESVVDEDTWSESTKVENANDEKNTTDEDSKTEEAKIGGSTSNIKPEEVIKSIEEVINTELGRIIKEVDKRSSHSSNEEYDGTIEVTKDVEQHPPSDTDANQEKDEIVNLNPEVSVIDAFIFGYIVFCFYVKYFYQRICSFAQVSRTTSTLKPFEIHAVSTSTSTLLETAELISKIEEEISEEDEDSSIEESNADVVETNQSDLDENLRRTLSSIDIGVLPNITEISGEDDVEDLIADIEELTLNSSARDSEQSEASLLPSFDEESVAERYNYVLQTLKLKEEWTSSEDHSADQRSQFPSFISTDICSENNRSNSLGEPEELAANESVFTFDSELEKLQKLLQPEKEIETFQFNEVEVSRSEKSLLEDIQELCEDLLHVAVKAETKEDALEPEEIRINDTQVKSNILTSQCEQENSQNESNVKAATSGKQASAYEEGVSEEQNVQETENSIGQTETTSSAPFDTTPEEIDSFDSNYTRLSEASRNSATVDLDVSSMEEFSIASNQDA